MVDYGDRCLCSCHTVGGIHFFPCCAECHYCKERISISLYGDHFEACRKEHDKWFERQSMHIEPQEGKE